MRTSKHLIEHDLDVLRRGDLNKPLQTHALTLVQDLAEACRLLEALRQQAYMRQDYRTEAQIAAFLGVRSAMEHELAEDKP